MSTADFALLHPTIQHHILNTLGWRELRPLQSAAITPILSGSDLVVLAPTAGGKTEAVVFPLLTRMESEDWKGVSLIYVCPTKALLNNVSLRIAAYAGWLGRQSGVRHGDTAAGERSRQQRDPPSLLLTTPESLESMLVSPLVDTTILFGGVRAVIIDEVHAFAGDDRGWHLLGVLDRIEALAGQPVQRLGLSATVGDPDALLTWLQGRQGPVPPGRVLQPPRIDSSPAQLMLDFVGSVDNAARVISAIHVGEKRLVFADSRRVVEELAGAITELGTETYLSHSSLSLESRRRAEGAFAEARNCVIVATSTLELGVDVGDLDRVVQVGAPLTVSSLLQRLGRTGRRAGTCRNIVFLATDEHELLRAAGLALLHSRDFVDPVPPPPSPRHVAAQQLLGRVLQKRRVDLASEAAAISALSLIDRAEMDQVCHWLLSCGYLDLDSGLAFIGPEAAQRFGTRHFRDLLAVFTTNPEMSVLNGREQIGSIDPSALTGHTTRPRILALGGRAWVVEHVDWRRRLVHVKPSHDKGRARWPGESRPYSAALTDGIRQVLLGEPLGATQLTARATAELEQIRSRWAARVHPHGTVVSGEGRMRQWWTFAGERANAVLSCALDEVAPGLRTGEPDNFGLPVQKGTSERDLTVAMAEALSRHGDDLRGVEPLVDLDALARLRFAELLPPELAAKTLSTRRADHPAAARTARLPISGR